MILVGAADDFGKFGKIWKTYRFKKKKKIKNLSLANSVGHSVKIWAPVCILG